MSVSENGKAGEGRMGPQGAMGNRTEEAAPCLADLDSTCNSRGRRHASSDVDSIVDSIAATSHTHINGAVV